MARWVIFIVFIFKQSIPISGQDNLIPNGSFDDSVKCGSTSTIAHWFVPQNDPVNVNNLCSYIDWWRFIKDKKSGINGTQCGFIETFYSGFADDNIYSGRLYLAVKLIKPLEAGKQYYFEMYLRSVDTFPNKKLVNTIFTNGQDISFTKELPLFDFVMPRNYLQLKPVAVTPLYADYDWHKFSHCFIADGSERFLIIGNFRNDVNTETKNTGKQNPNFPNGRIANYAVDDVVLTPMEINLSDTSLCNKDTLLLNVGKTAPPSLTYRWQDASTTPEYRAIKSESLNIRMNYSPECYSEKQVKVNTYDHNLPVNQLTHDTTVCEGQAAVLKAGVQLAGQVIQWNDGSKLPVREVYDPGIYIANIEHRCLRVTRKFSVGVEVCDQGIYTANVFTPNGDGINDEFIPRFKPDYPLIERYEMSIFNRWGNLLFYSNTIDRGWDGRHFNNEVPPGVYIYSLKIEIKSRIGTRALYKKGDVTLVK